MAGGIGRRDFVLGVGGAALFGAWPVAARAQRVRLIGFLNGVSQSQGERRVAAFKEGMRERGWIEGTNVRYEVRFGDGDRERISAYAKELVQMAPDFIMCNTTPATAALQRETKSIPIVFAVVSDPVGDGFVASLSHPGGNVTGFVTFYPEMVGKWIELLKEIAPHITRSTLMFNPLTAPFSMAEFLRPQFESSARSFSIEPSMSPVQNPAEIQASIEAISRTPGGSLVIMPDSFMAVNRPMILQLAASHRLPVMYPFGYFTPDGGLISYGVDLLDQNRRAAEYGDRILKGEKPADLPVQTPTRFELIINLRTANALGLTVPESLLLRADEVIE